MCALGHRDIVYFRCAVPTNPFPDEALPIGGLLAPRLAAAGISVDAVEHDYDDFVIGCRTRERTCRVELTTYAEATPLQYSLHVKVPRWFARSDDVRALLAAIDESLHGSPDISTIEWHRYADLRRRRDSRSRLPSGTSHPFE